MIILKSICVLLTFLWHVTNCQPDDETSIISNEENTGTTQAYIDGYDDYYEYHVKDEDCAKLPNCPMALDNTKNGMICEVDILFFFL